MEKSIIATQSAPAAIGPYSQGTGAGHMVFTSGQISLDPATGSLVGSNAAEQAEQCLKNLQAVLQAGGAGMETVVKTTVFLVDMADFAAVNEVYARWFEGAFPARSCIAVRGLPKGALVEVEAVAFKR